MGNQLERRKEVITNDDQEYDSALRISSNYYREKIREFAKREIQRANRKSAPAFFNSEEIQKFFGQISESSRIPTHMNRSSSTGLFYGNIDDNQMSTFYDSNEKSQEVIKTELFLKCKKRLSIHYTTNNIQLRSYVWDGQGYDFPLNQYLIKFNLKNDDLCGRKKKEAVELKDILNKEGHQMILVTGGPGFGKTTLCKKLAYDWASDECSGYLKHFDIAVVINMNTINDKTILDCIIEASLDESERDIVNSLKHRINLNFLIILDGYDEICDRNYFKEFIKNDSFLISRNITIIITSRPHAVEDIREYMDKCISIEGFTKENQKKYIEMFNLAVSGNNEEHFRSVISLLEDDQSLLGLAECPLLLHMLCCLHWERSISKIERTEVYLWLFSHLVDRYIRKKEGNTILEIGKHFLGENLLVRLGKLAWNCVFHNEPLNPCELKEEFPNTDEYDTVLGFGILNYSHSTFEGQDLAIYEPINKSFFQFLSALYISSDEQLTSDIFVKSVFDENIFLFMCGLINQCAIANTWLDYPLYNGFKPSFLKNVRKEMKNEAIWETFSSGIHLRFSVNSCSNEFVEFLNNSGIKNIFLTLPEVRSEYEEIKENLINILKSYKHEETLQLYVYVIVSSKYSLANSFADIREHAKLIVDLLSYFKMEKRCKIILNGVNFFEMYFPFVKILKFNEILQEEEEDLKFCIQGMEECTGLKIEQGNIFLISNEQYQVLHEYINLHQNADD